MISVSSNPPLDKVLAFHLAPIMVCGMDVWYDIPDRNISKP